MKDVLLSDDTKAIILLCAVLGKDRSVKPLTQTEYSALVRCLMAAELRPGDLLHEDRSGPMSAGTGLDRQRLTALLGQGVQLGFAVEEWQQNGIWILSRGDSQYPFRYKKHLREKAPPLLFGMGNRALLRGGGLAVVGSRDVDQAGMAFTRQVAEKCARDGIPVVSGGARGVDQTAMTAALEAGGPCIGVLADSLLKKGLERSARHGIAEGRLLLLSPYHPNARFSVGGAMGRNKLIYAMADWGLVVSAAFRKGGTWAGAEEELKRPRPRSVFVRVGPNTPSGNHELQELGALPWPQLDETAQLSRQLTQLAAQCRDQQQRETPGLFDAAEHQDSRQSADGEKGRMLSSIKNL